MSRPTNELSKFRSYSYYHVLAICDSSQTATDLSASTSLDTWQHATDADRNIEGVTFLGKYGVKSVGGDSAGKYCILINGSTDASLSITKANWTSYTASSATMSDRNTSIALEGSLSISEPRGIMFLDQVVKCCIELGVDSAHAFWVLKTFFVGYTYDDEHGDGVEHITDIPPVVFLAYDVVGNFGPNGGEYDINFVAAANSAARMPHFSKSVQAVNIKAEGTFSATLNKLADEINNNYERYYKCVEDQVRAIPNGGDELAKSLRKVKYSVSCGEPYADNPAYQVEDQAAQLKDIANCGSPANIHVSAGISIEDAIHRIIGMCSKIKQEASEGVGGIKYTTKIFSWVTSEPVSEGSSEKRFAVGYRVERQPQPKSVSFEDFNGSRGTPSSNNPNLIEFDYLYTGKNIDILEFDIKMNMGMVYLQGMTISNPYKQPGVQAAIGGTSVASDGLLRQNRQNIPVFFGTQIKTSSIKDTNDALNTAQHSYSMTSHASLEMLEATVKITGNSRLLGSINHTSDPIHVRDRVSYSGSSNFSQFSDWTLTPSFAKINIKMPRNNDDISLFSGSGPLNGTQTSSDNVDSNDYAVDFWFTGYYYVYGIEHVFDNGEFYQILNALSIPEKNSFNLQQNSAQEQDFNLNKRVESCYEHTLGCGSGAVTGRENDKVVVPVARSSSGTSVVPNLSSDAAAANANNTSLSGIKGYDKIKDPRVKDAIKKAAMEEGVDEVTLAQMCAAESKFDPSATNKWGYKGLFQFGKDGWADYGSGDIYDPYDNSKAAAKMMRHNQDSLRKQLGREPTKGEVYMAHQQGLGGAKKIMRKVEAGGAEAKSGGLISAANAANNRIDNTSAEGIHNYSETYMAKQLVHPIPIVENNKVAPLKARTGADSSSEVSEQASTPVRTARDSVAATRSCTDDEKVQNDPAKSERCQKLPGNKQDDTTTSTAANSTPTGTASPKTQSVVVLKKDVESNLFPATTGTGSSTIPLIGEQIGKLI